VSATLRVSQHFSANRTVMEHIRNISGRAAALQCDVTPRRRREFPNFHYGHISTFWVSERIVCGWTSPRPHKSCPGAAKIFLSNFYIYISAERAAVPRVARARGPKAATLTFPFLCKCDMMENGSGDGIVEYLVHLSSVSQGMGLDFHLH
jgi:hypothetical protein